MVICVAGLLGAAVAGTVDRICMEVDLAEEADTLGCVVDSAAPPSPTSPASPAPPTAVLVVGACVVAAVVSESVVVAWYVVVAATIVVVVGLGKAAVVCWASAHVPFLKTKT